MWLRDALPHDLPGARVLTYGYDTRLADSNSFQNLEDVALTFRASLRIALGSRPPDRPLIFIAHSLGGLVLKQALIQMASEDRVDRRIFQSTYGILFFGVPNQGMDISSLLAMVGSQPNLPLLTMLSKDSGSLQGLVKKFRTVFDFKDSEIVSLYETYASPTARKDALGKWSMSGDHAVLVDRFSARSGRLWEESHSFLQPIGRNHSDMVKFSEYDDLNAIAGDFLIRFARAAPAVIRDRVNRLESSTTSSASDKAATAKLERPSSSGPGICNNENDLEIFANAGFDIEDRSSRNLGLTWAARKGHVSLARRLLHRGTTIEHKDVGGWTPLHWAAFTASLGLFRLLLSRGAKCSAKTNSNNSTLHLVCSFGKNVKDRESDDYIGSSPDRVAICLELLDHGIRVDVLNASRATPLLCAAECGLDVMVRVLISRRATLIQGKAYYCKALLGAAAHGHLGVVITLIETLTKDYPRELSCSLFVAASKGMESAVKVLLDAGLMINSVEQYGNTALIAAAFYSHERIVRLLLDEGADIEAKNSHGETAMHWAVMHTFPQDRNTMSQPDTIQLLIDRGANLRAKSKHGTSVLHVAVKSNNLIAVNMLLEAGADPLSRNDFGQLPLDLALREGYKEVEERLRLELPLIEGNKRNR